MRKIDLYLDFDGVIWDSWPMFYDFLNSNSNQEEINNYFKNLDWEKILNESNPLKNSIKAIEALNKSGLYNIHVLTNCNSEKEAWIKKQKLIDLGCKIDFIPVFNRKQKAFIVNPYNSILVDDYSLNLYPFEEQGGVGIKFRKSLKDNQDYIKINNLMDLINIYPEIRNKLNENKKKTKTLNYNPEDIKNINSFIETLPLEFRILAGKKIYQLYRENEIQYIKKNRTNINVKDNKLTISKKRITKANLVYNYTLTAEIIDNKVFIDIKTLRENKIDNEKSNVTYEKVRHCFTGDKICKNYNESKNVTVFKHNQSITDIHNYIINTNRKYDERDRQILINQWISDEENVYSYPLSKLDFFMKNHYKYFSFLKGIDRQIISQQILYLNNVPYILSKYSKFYENGEQAIFTIISYEENLINPNHQLEIDSKTYYNLLNNNKYVMSNIKTIEINPNNILEKQLVYKNKKIRENNPKGR